MFWLRTHNGTMAAMANYQGGCLGSLHFNFAMLHFWCHDFFAGFSELTVTSAMNLFKKTMCYINCLNSPLINSRLENLRTFSVHTHVENKLKPKIFAAISYGTSRLTWVNFHHSLLPPFYHPQLAYLRTSWP